VIDHLLKNVKSQKISGVFLYCNYKQKEIQKPKNILGSILKDVIKQHPSLIKEVQKMYTMSASENISLDLNDYIELLIKITSHLDRRFILIDALDESCETRNDLVESLAKLQKHVQHIQLFLTSRQNMTLAHAFLDFHIITITAKEVDIDLYVKSRARKERNVALLLQNDQSGELESRIVDKIKARCEGMFLLAVLYLDALKHCRVLDDLEHALMMLPVDLDGIYMEAFRRIQEQNPADGELAAAIISWISYSRTPLKIKQLLHAVATTTTKLDQKVFDLRRILPVEDIDELCAGLVTVDQETNSVRLVHASIQNFINREWSTLLPNSRLNMAKASICYLSYSNFSSPCTDRQQMLTRQNEFPFLQYAARIWGYLAAENESEMLETILSFLNSRGNFKSSQQAMKNSLQGSTKLGTAAKFGLYGTVSKLLEQGSKVNEYTSVMQTTAAHVAAFGGHTAVLTLLLDEGADVNVVSRQGSTILQAASFSNDWANVEKILSSSTDTLEWKNCFGKIALLEAAERGNTETVRALLHYGADPSTKDTIGRTPLSSAILNGSVESVRELLTQNVNILQEETDPSTTAYKDQMDRSVAVAMRLRLSVPEKPKSMTSNTIFQIAADHGRKEILEFLVAFGRSCLGDPLNCPNKYGSTALCNAAWQGDADFVTFLLDAGAKLSSDNNSRTALHYAARAGNMAVLKALMDHPSGISEDQLNLVGTEADGFSDWSGGTAIEEAVARENSDAVKFLLVQGALNASMQGPFRDTDFKPTDKAVLDWLMGFR
jgi:ankyrin repeat protein